MDEQKKIMLAHGGGGRLMGDLIARMIVPKFGDGQSVQLTDSAVIDVPADKICFTTDSFVVQPLFFNGGDIGKLSVCGTVNDLAVAGAKPIALSLSLILEEGLEMAVLEKILQSIADTAKAANVDIVTGDTKVVEAGSADGVFINTSGVGALMDDVDLSFTRIKPGDAILVNGTLGDHGMTIMSQREGLKFDTPLKSDCACLGELTQMLCENCGGGAVRFMRDPTRGGLAATLNEVAKSSGVNVELTETALPVDKTVQTAADMLGFDLLNIANEGKVLAVVDAAVANKAIEAWRSHPLGENAAVIGHIMDADDSPLVELITKIGGRRIVQTPYGRELPRIC
ncbi:MAG: hydrogenase expression/formation protein HypE [Planctomycetales bacterium 4572_13]|nr:MAG: hydrogenase expression/formation protein HypE [Planctomycetales bacterium 4572_13]